MIIQDLSPGHAAIVMFYFSFTTLMTIGLGDYAPRGIFEVALAGVGMLGGVIVLTIIKDNFIKIYNFFLEVEAPLEEREELAKFFMIIKSFNGDILDLDMKVKMERYFEHRW